MRAVMPVRYAVVLALCAAACTWWIAPSARAQTAAGAGAVTSTDPSEKQGDKDKGKGKRKDQGKRKGKGKRKDQGKRKGKGKRKDKGKGKGKASPSPRANMPKGFVWPPSKQMLALGASCREALSAAGVAYEIASRRQVEAKARMVAPIVPTGMVLGGVSWVPTYRKPPFVMDCHLALALQRVGPTLAALGVQTVHFSRIYEFSRVRAYGKKSRAISRHALGLAIDIRKIEGVSADGLAQLVTIVDDYHASAWLKEIEAALNASGLFRTVLGPANDPKSHYDHFHVEAAASFAP